MKDWYEIAAEGAPFIVKIETPEGHGTGFLCAYNDNGNIVAIATAPHVIGQADKWLHPIRIHTASAEETVFLQEQDRVIWSEPEQDAAVTLVQAKEVKALNLPKKPIPLQRSGRHLKVGVEVAWLGYPGIGPETLCFFSGKISAWETKQQIYLIDGVAISGVTAAPFCIGERMVLIKSSERFRRTSRIVLPLSPCPDFLLLKMLLIFIKASLSFAI